MLIIPYYNGYYMAKYRNFKAKSLLHKYKQAKIFKNKRFKLLFII